MKVHIFQYDWPRIEEGLNHREAEVLAPWSLPQLAAKQGSWLLCEGHWYRTPTQGRPFKSLDAVQVPKQIRALALILT